MKGRFDAKADDEVSHDFQRLRRSFYDAFARIVPVFAPLNFAVPFKPAEVTQCRRHR